MKLGKTFLMFSLISIVFLAGCTSGGKGGATSAGVVITSFAPDIQKVDGGPVSFTAAVQNTGEKTATNIKLLFFGLSNEWKDADTAFNEKPDSSISTLAPADSASGLKGEQGSADLTLTAPEGKSTDVTYDASVRVFYTYGTDADTLLRFVQSSYLKTNPNVAKGIQSHSSTAGPITISAVARTPVLSGTSTIGRVQFEIQNVGGGRVYSGDVDNKSNPSGLDQLTSIAVSGLGSKGSCAGQAAGDASTITTVRLVGGKSKIISCSIDVNEISNFADRALNVTVKYNYFVDGATQVTVTKNLEELSGTPAPAGGGAVTAAQACNGRSAGAACHDTDALGNTFSGKCNDLTLPSGTVRTCVKQ